MGPDRIKSSLQLVGLDASAKHPNDRDSYTGPDKALAGLVLVLLRRRRNLNSG